MRWCIRGAAVGLILASLLASGCMVVTNGSTTGKGARSTSSTLTTQPGGPLINSMSAASPTVVANGSPVMLTVAANSPTGYAPLTYQWSSTGGALSATRGSAVQWIPPSTPGTYQVGVLVADTQGRATVGTFNLQVLPAPSAIPSPSPSTSPRPSPIPSPTASPTATPSASPTP